MNALEGRQFDMLVRVRDFGDANRELFPESSLARQAFASLGDQVAQIEAHHRRKLTTSVAARAGRKDAARQELAESLLRISQTSRVLDADTPGVAAQFTAPPRARDHTLLTMARHFVDAAAPLADRFIQHGLPPTFVEDLRRQTDTFAAALRERGMSRDERMAATESIRSLIAAAMAVARKLDVLVANHLADDEVRRKVWQTDRRVVSARSPRATAEGQDGEAAATTPAAQPASTTAASPAGPTATATPAAAEPPAA